MKVILSRDISKLGRRNDVKDVNDGYARNFLLPRGLAIPATPSALQTIETKRVWDEEERIKNEARYRNFAEKLSCITLQFKMKVGEKGKAFGSVSERDIQQKLQKEGLMVEKDWIVLDEHIKTTGEHTVPIQFPYEIKGAVKVVVESV